MSQISNLKLSKRARQLTPSPTLAITAKAKALKSQGLDVIGLGAGEPDFNTPKHILTAAQTAMEEGQTKYTASAGVPELIQAIIEKLRNENGLSYQSNQISVTVGAKHALYNLFQVLLDEGDEVIIPSPYWVSYLDQVKLAGGAPVVIEGKEEHSFKITPEQLEQAITDHTRAVIINSPSNPTGMLYSREELEAIGEVCIKRDILIISDEIYEHLIYDDQPHVSIASLSPELYARTFVINGLSKTFSMTGWRIGYIAGDSEVIAAITDLSSHSVSNATTFAQYAAVAALTGTKEPVEEMKKSFKERRDYVIGRINQIPGLSCQKPAGAFYAFVNIREALESSPYQDPDQWSEALLEKEQVAVVPGSGFGSNDHIRISYATSMQNLREALDRIERFVKNG